MFIRRIIAECSFVTTSYEMLIFIIYISLMHTVLFFFKTNASHERYS